MDKDTLERLRQLLEDMRMYGFGDLDILVALDAVEDAIEAAAKEVNAEEDRP